MNTKGFTLLELMIVMSMIAILMGSAFFPFEYYLARSRIEKNIDSLSQEWIVLHQDIRNGLLQGNNHAAISVKLKKGASSIPVSTLIPGSATITPYKEFLFDPQIIILSFTGSIPSTVDTIDYLISPPFATGSFSFDGGVGRYLSGVILELGYKDMTPGDPRIRQILLRPYYD